MGIKQFEENGYIYTGIDWGESSEFQAGIVLGPPESLKDLLDMSNNLTPVTLKKLFVELNMAGLYNAEDVNGKRSVLAQIVKRVTGKLDNSLIRQILHLYQVDFYGE
jgi:hypothetical protein